jgi:hypothetical protein
LVDPIVNILYLAVDVKLPALTDVPGTLTILPRTVALLAKILVESGGVAEVISLR